MGWDTIFGMSSLLLKVFQVLWCNINSEHQIYCQKDLDLDLSFATYVTSGILFNLFTLLFPCV